jgi:hypothetical protein
MENCQYGVPTEIITNQEKEFCTEVTFKLYKAMKLKPEAVCQFFTFYFQEKTANRTINKYLKQIFELTTTDWKIYLAPNGVQLQYLFQPDIPEFSLFIIFGQHARQPAFNHESGRRSIL